MLLLVCICSCTKQGTTGPAGPQGPAGAAGVAGANGATIYSGNGAPSATTGNVGDFYIDLSASALYGPKSASGWGTGYSLVGAPGAPGAAGATGATGAAGTNGAPGSQILSGTGAPAATLGNSGDYYLDKSSGLLYGPKNGTDWGTPTSLIGPAGSANVIYSAWNYATNFRDTTIDASMVQAATLTATELTSAYISDATILVYFTFGAGVFQLPYTSYAGGKGSTISFIPEVGQILVTRFTFDNSASITMSTLLEFRFVIIPGGVYVPNSLDYPTISHLYRIRDN